MNKHRQMMYDDLFFSGIGIIVSIVMMTDRNLDAFGVGSAILIFCLIWFGVRLYHFIHRDTFFPDE